MISAVAIGNNPENENNTLKREAVSISTPAQQFGRKPTFKNIRELTEQDLESLKCKQSTAGQ